MVFNVDDGEIAASLIPQTTIDLNYGFNNTDNSWSRFITDTDDGSIATGQKPQLVNGLMYYYSDKTNAWHRWEGDDSGSLYTAVIGLYTPTFDSMCDDTLDALNVSVLSSVLPTGAATSDKQLADNHNVTVSNIASTPLVDVSSLATSANQLPDDHNVTVSNMIPAVETGLATSANQLPNNHQVTANAGTNLNTSLLSTSSNQTNKTQMTQITNGTSEVDIHENSLYTSDIYHNMGEGLITDHKPFLKIGYNPEVSNVEECVCSQGGSYAFSKGEGGLEVVSSDNTQDIGTQIHTGTSTGGSTTTLIDTGADFTSGTSVAIFDWVILDKSGTIPEYGQVTGVTATTLTIAGGFSKGGSGNGRDYIVLDYSAHTCAQAVNIHYLDESFDEHDEIVILNGTTVVPTVNTDYYRINSFKVVAAGSVGKALGNISLRDLADTPIYANITSGYTISRQLIFTVPNGKTLYLNSLNVGWCSPNDSKVQSARMILRCNFEASNEFITGNIFHPYVEVMVTNADVNIFNPIPFKIISGVDLIVSCQSTNAAGEGPATGVMRGWMVTD